MGTTWLIVRETPAHRFASIRRDDIPPLHERPEPSLFVRLLDWWHTWRAR